MKNIYFLIFLSIFLVQTNHVKGQDISGGVRFGMAKVQFMGNLPKETNGTTWSKTDKLGYIVGPHLHFDLINLHIKMGFTFSDLGGKIIREIDNGTEHKEDIYDITVKSFGGQFDLLFGKRIRIMPIGLNFSMPTGHKMRQTHTDYLNPQANGSTLSKDQDLKFRVNFQYSVGFEISLINNIHIGYRYQLASSERFDDNKGIFGDNKSIPLRPTFQEFTISFQLSVFD